MTTSAIRHSHLSLSQQEALGPVSALYDLPEPQPASGQTLRFGLMADPQYADCDPANNRYYRNSLEKLRYAIGELNAHPLSFVVTLGDMVDRAWQSFDPVLRCYQALHHPHFTVMGNHDAAVISAHLAPYSLPLPKHYYAFTLPGYRFVVIDGNDISLYCNHANGPDHRQATAMLATLEHEQQPHAQPWNGAVGPTQLAWLTRQLKEAEVNNESAIVFGHYPLTPANKHNLWNCQQLVALLSEYQVRAYFAGHDHLGGYQRVASTPFCTLRGMVDGQDPEPPFAIVEVDSTALRITGFGHQPSCLIPRSPPER